MKKTLAFLTLFSLLNPSYAQDFPKLSLIDDHWKLEIPYVEFETSEGKQAYRAILLSENVTEFVIEGTSVQEVEVVNGTSKKNIWQPKPGTRWQWQLEGEIDTSLDVEMYDIDLVDTSQNVIDQLHNAGKIVICYFSAGSWEKWREDAEQFPDSVIGNKLDGWAGEKWLDIRKLEELGPIMEARLDLAVQKKCDGVEPDNVDGYANKSGFDLTAQDQRTYNMGAVPFVRR